MIRLKEKSEIIKKGSYVQVNLKVKDENFLKMMRKTENRSFTSYIYVNIECLIEDFCGLFLEFDLDKDEIDIELLEEKDYDEKIKDNIEFTIMTSLPNFKYIHWAAQDRKIM